MKYVIFHGSFGSPESNWFPELKEKLEMLGQKVVVPEFPIEDWDDLTKKGQKATLKNQTLNNWLKVFAKEVKKFKKNEKLCFVGHSLGPVFILHAVNKFNIKLDCAIFVSPFLSLEKSKKMWQIDIANQTFYKKNFDYKRLKRLIPISYVLYSDNDPYVPKKYPLEFAKKMESSAIFVKKAGHMNSEVNLNEFPLVYELCKTRINLSLYQRYIEHRKDLYSVDYTKGRSEEVIYLNPDGVFDEGTFKFRNLRKEGFATFYTALKFWNTQSRYFKEARRAAKRVPLKRVFVLKNIGDLKNPNLIKQMSEDLEAGIKIYLLMHRDLDKNIAPDFGLWDNDYCCIINLNKKGQVKNITMSSRKEDLKKANIWKSKILKKAVQIFDTDEDLEKFTNSFK